MCICVTITACVSETHVSSWGCSCLCLLPSLHSELWSHMFSSGVYGFHFSSGDLNLGVCTYIASAFIPAATSSVPNSVSYSLYTLGKLLFMKLIIPSILSNYLLSVCICGVHPVTLSGSHVECRGQLLGAGSLLLPLGGFQGLNSDHWAC